MAAPPPVVLTIAGFDPSSGAGATADLKTMAAHGCYGVSCLTALTVQNTVSVGAIEPIRPEIIRHTLEKLVSDFEIAAVRIGMLGNAAEVCAVAGFLNRHSLPNVVLDPVLRSSSGTDLLDGKGIAVLMTELLPVSDVVTPNCDEATALTGMPAGNLDDMRRAAERLHEKGARAVVITGGHLSPAVDLLSVKTPLEIQQQTFAGEQLSSNSTHGTGCAFATALACELAWKHPLDEAVKAAKLYVFEAIRNAYSIGKGRGPINHLHRLQR
jgi:hydroxymethylpyrimidine/phosphomethylpyrimidine kinase